MAQSSEIYDVIVLGAGAAGLFCAATAAKRGFRVLAIDHAQTLGEKIRISGGGRCNFTNIHTGPQNFISQNPKFCISALKGFTPRDFLDRVETANIAWHEKKLGQLFCDDSAKQIVDLLVDDCRDAGVKVQTGVAVEKVEKNRDEFHLKTGAGNLRAKRLVIATGGKSIPKLGASGFGYEVARAFDLDVVEPRPALVPLTFEGEIKEMAKALAGVSVDAAVSTPVSPATTKGKTQKPPAFRDGFLFTHRGLSGPSILQISSFWREGNPVSIDFSPAENLFDALKRRRQTGGKAAFQSALAELLPKRLAQKLCEREGWRGNLADWSDDKLKDATARIHCWTVTPAGSEGYRTAEVTLGGVDTNALHSKSMEVNSVPGLFFIGEVVDVTGWLGGHNFQWAWSSAYAAAQSM